MKRAVILHGTDGSPEHNWFPWLKEELGISLKSDQFEELGKFYNEGRFESRKLNRFYKTYRFRTDKTQFEYDKNEIAEIKWFSADQIKEMIKNKPHEVTDGLQQVIDRYYS